MANAIAYVPYTGEPVTARRMWFRSSLGIRIARQKKCVVGRKQEARARNG